MLGDGPEAFHGVFADSGVESVTLPSTLKQLGWQAFKGCKNLKRVQIPQRLEYVGTECFSESGLEEASFPATLKTLEYRAFM